MEVIHFCPSFAFPTLKWSRTSDLLTFVSRNIGSLYFKLTNRILQVDCHGSKCLARSSYFLHGCWLFFCCSRYSLSLTGSVHANRIYLINWYQNLLTASWSLPQVWFSGFTPFHLVDQSPWLGQGDLLVILQSLPVKVEHQRLYYPFHLPPIMIEVKIMI